jgi:hypothetical protein
MSFVTHYSKKVDSIRGLSQNTSEFNARKSESFSAGDCRVAVSEEATARVIVCVQQCSITGGIFCHSSSNWNFGDSGGGGGDESHHPQ